MALPVMLLPCKAEMSGHPWGDSYSPLDILLRYTNLIDLNFFSFTFSSISHC